MMSKKPEYPPAANHQEFDFLVDGRVFDHDSGDQRVSLSDVEEWTIVNDDPSDHVFHIHTNPLHVTKLSVESLAIPV